MIRFLVLSLLLVVPARAEMPAGHDDPRFQAAVAAWLDADDEVSLPALAQLAREGNTAAQILLGRIDQDSSTFSPFLKSMPVKERRALLRAPGGKFPKSWLRTAAESSRLASALQNARFADQDRVSIIELISLGEIGLARMVAWRMYNQGLWNELVSAIPERTDDDVLTQTAWAAAFYAEGEAAEALQEEARHAAREMTPLTLYGLRAAELEPEGSAERRAQIAAFRWAVSGIWPPDPTKPEIPIGVLRLVSEASISRPLIELCRQRCASSAEACYFLGHFLAGGLMGLERLGSPVETLVSTERYAASPRSIEDLLGLMVTSPSVTHNRDRIADELRTRDQCLAELILERTP